MTIIQTLKEGIKNKSVVKYHKQSIDLQTANCLLTVYEALNDKNKEKFLRMADNNLPKLIDFCWGQVK